jgi:hypothetical protein
MRGTRKLQTEVEKLVLSTADAAHALRQIAELLCRQTDSTMALLVRREDNEEGSTILAHPGLSAPHANALCATIAPYRAACLRTSKPFTVATLGESIPTA